MEGMAKGTTTHRLLSLDVLRGLIMLLLAAESCMLYESLNDLPLPAALHTVVQQFFHHPWNGLRFWDLVQPAFMTMAGSAMYLSYYYKSQKGISWQQNFRHIVIRCVKLFVCGTALHCIYAGRLVWELWNVLTQLSFTTLIAYMIIRKSAWWQIAFSLLLLLLTEMLYRLVLMPGFTQPFVSGQNFGNWMDLVVMGKMNSDGWVFINIIPTAAHTIWGVVAGKLLVSTQGPANKIRLLLIAAATGLLLGYALDWSGVTPIIKRISTSAFALASGGWVMAMLALLYWIVDVKQWNRSAWFFVVVGMNAIFIYLFFETLGHQWLNNTVGIFIRGALGVLSVPGKITVVLSACATLFTEWYICYWLYTKKIFIKL